jgi:hypothetical protein
MKSRFDSGSDRGTNPPFNKRKPPEPRLPGTEMGYGDLEAAAIRAAMERGTGCLCAKCTAYRRREWAREEPKRIERERQKLERKTEQARIDQSRGRER